MLRVPNSYRKILTLSIVILLSVVIIFCINASNSILETMLTANGYKHNLSSMKVELLPEKLDNDRVTYMIEDQQAIMLCLESLSDIRIVRAFYRTKSYHDMAHESYIISLYDNDKAISSAILMRKDVAIGGKQYRAVNYTREKMYRFYELVLKYGRLVEK